VRTLLGPLLVVAGFLAYFAAAMSLALFQRVPWGFLLVMAGGLTLSLLRLVRGPSVGRATAAVASVVLCGFAGWYLFSYSMLGVREDRPRVGDPFPSFALAASDGSTFRLEDARERYLMLLFYRGDW